MSINWFPLHGVSMLAFVQNVWDILVPAHYFPAHRPGSTIHMQAWALRRMLSLFNAVTRRPHKPREPAIREMMKAMGMELNGPQEADGSGEESEHVFSEDEPPAVGEEEFHEEDLESEYPEEDPCGLAQFSIRTIDVSIMLHAHGRVSIKLLS